MPCGASPAFVLFQCRLRQRTAIHAPPCGGANHARQRNSCPARGKSFFATRGAKISSRSCSTIGKLFVTFQRWKVTKDRRDRRDRHFNLLCELLAVLKELTAHKLHDRPESFPARRFRRSPLPDPTPFLYGRRNRSSIIFRAWEREPGFAIRLPSPVQRTH